LPLLSRQLKAGDGAGAAESQNRAVEFTLLLTLPAAVALLAVPAPIVAVLFEHGRFGAEESRATAAALAAFAAGLPAYVLVKVLLPSFYAREDIATPVRVAVVALAVNAVLAVVLGRSWGATGIAIAASAAAWMNAAGLALVLRRRAHFVMDVRLRARLPRMAGAALLMGAVLLAGERALAAAFAGPVWLQAPALAALVVGGVAVFAGLALVLGAARMADVRAALRKG